MLAGCISIEANQPGKTPQEMTYDEALAKYRQLGEVKEFLNTDTPLKYPWSMDKFFDRDIYQKLKGNEFFGYYHDQGVTFSGSRIAIDTVAAIKGQGYETFRDTYIKILLQTLRLYRKNPLTIDKQAPFSLGICIVSVKAQSNDNSPVGLVLETYIKDRRTGRYFFHRCGTGVSGSLEQAMALSVARILCNLDYLRSGKNSQAKERRP